jgi:hypothetical protein
MTYAGTSIDVGGVDDVDHDDQRVVVQPTVDSLSTAPKKSSSRSSDCSFRSSKRIGSTKTFIVSATPAFPCFDCANSPNKISFPTQCNAMQCNATTLMSLTISNRTLQTLPTVATVCYTGSGLLCTVSTIQDPRSSMWRNPVESNHGQGLLLFVQSQPPCSGATSLLIQAWNLLFSACWSKVIARMPVGSFQVARSTKTSRSAIVHFVRYTITSSDVTRLSVILKQCLTTTPQPSQIMEETGFDARDFINDDEFLSVTSREQQVRQYVIAGVSEDTVFAPRTRKEISVWALVVVVVQRYDVLVLMAWHLM